MPDKICEFCGEPIAGGLQEHDLSDCAYYLKDNVAQLEAENERLQIKLISIDCSKCGMSMLGCECVEALGGE